MRRSFLLGILALAVGTAPVSAALYVVDRDDDLATATTCSDAAKKDCSLRGAILAANANPGTDTILIPGGVYTLTLSGDELLGEAGDLDVTDSVNIQGSGATGTTIQGCAPAAQATDCVGVDRIFHLHPATASPITVIMSGVTVQHGVTKGNGGGFLVEPGATLRLSSSVVRQNGADGDGGGVAVVAGATAVLTDTLVATNLAGGRGGGAFAGAVTAAPVSGGALGLTRSTVQDNVAGAGGGGVARLNGALSMVGSTVAHNQSASGLDDALAGSGGGVFIGMGDDQPSEINNSTISGNVGHLAGGIVALGMLLVEDATITANEMHSGGNGAGGIAAVGNLRIRNTIVAANVADPGKPEDCFGTVVSSGYNLIGDGDTCSGVTDGMGGDQVGTAAAPIDPKLGPLALNAGPTRTHALLPGSPAINAGNPDAPESSSDACTLVDQSGVPVRGTAQTGRCDIGALELSGSGTTTTTVESTTSTTESSTSTTEPTTTTEVTSTTVIVVTTTTESTTSTSISSTTETSMSATSTSTSATSTSSIESTSTSTSTTETTTSTTATSSSSTSTSSSSTSSTSTTLPPPVEICGNCIDDDGNGLTDFEDPACCAQLQLAAMNVQKAGLSVAKGSTTLKLTASLVQSGLSTGTASDQDVHLQIRRPGETDVLCARIPAANLTRKKNTLRFHDKKHAVGSAAGLDNLVLKGKKTGAASLTVGGSRLAISLPPAGDVEITLGLRNATTAEDGNRCTKAQITLKAGRKGGLKFP